MDANGQVVTSVTITEADAADWKSFGTITFHDEGTYSYIITETVPDDAENAAGVKYKDRTDSDAGPWTLNGLTYADPHTVTFVVAKDNEGHLTFTSPEASEVLVVVEEEFTNTYDAEGEAELFARKIENGNLGEREFTFVMTPVDGAPMPGDAASVTKKVTQGQTVSFGKIDYELADLNGEESMTFTYKITESLDGATLNPDTGKYEKDGVTYDPTIWTVEVTVSNADLDGVLDVTYQISCQASENADPVTVEVDGDPSREEPYVEFNNEYNAKGTVILQAKKANNTQLGNTPFTFKLSPVDGAPMPVNDQGTVLGQITVTQGVTGSFEAIEYTFDDLEWDDVDKKYKGTFNYIITEVVPGDAVNAAGVKYSEREQGDYSPENPAVGPWKLNGITYSDMTVTATVIVTDTGTGTLTTQKTYYYQPGTADNAHSGSTQNAPEFTNKYNATGDAQISVTKELKNRAWKDDDVFTFTLSGAEASPTKPVKLPERAADRTITITKNDAGYTKTFGTIVFDQEATYLYKVVEESTNPISGITYSAEHYVRIRVVDDTHGNYVPTIECLNDEGEVIQGATTAVFTNVYTATGNTELKAKKVIDNWGNAESFTFILTGQDANTPMPTDVDAEGKVTRTITKTTPNLTALFGEITYALSDLGGADEKVFTYTIQEDLPEGVDTNNPTKDGITYDVNPHTVQVTVSDANHDGTLTTSVNYVGEATGATEATITNTYGASGEKELEAKKDINDWGKAEKFTFELTSVDGATMPDGAVNGKVSVDITPTTPNLLAKFGKILYTEEGTYRYIIQEVVPEGLDSQNRKDGITYDPNPHVVVVTVVDNHDGTMTATAKYDDKDSLVITNTYTATGHAELFATKAINDWGSARSFTFELSAADGVPMPSGADADGVVRKTVNKGGSLIAEFGTIWYDTADTYTYTIKEVVPGDAENADGVKYNEREAAPYSAANPAQGPWKLNGVTYDGEAHTATVVVTDNHDGTLGTAVSYDNAQASLTITNTYSASGTAELQAKKVINDWGDAESFTFKLTAVDNAPLPEDEVDGVVTKTINKGGSLTAFFGTMTYTATGVYTYKIVEVIPDDAENADGVKYSEREDAPYSASDPAEGPWKLDGITYDSTEHTATVTVTDTNHTGVLETVVAYQGEADPNATAATITNTYSATGKVELEAKKKINNWGNATSFTFELTPVGDVPMPDGTVNNNKKSVEITKNTPDLKALFGEIEYTSTGEYKYQIREKLPEGVTPSNPVKDGITYDTTAHDVVVTVTDNHNGTLTATPKYDNDASHIVMKFFDTEHVSMIGDGHAAHALGDVGQLQLFAHAGEDGQCQSEADGGAEGVDHALCQVEVLLYDEDGHAQHGAVGRDERQEDAQCLIEWGRDLLQHNLDHLHQRGDDQD